MNKRTKHTRTTRRAEERMHDARPPLLPYIRGLLPSLNPTERLIAEYVLADPEKVISSAVAELGQACGASVGAIVKFSQQTMGFKGFSDFRIALVRDLAQAGLPAGQEQRNGTLYEKVFHEHARSLKETLQVNSQDTFDRIAQALEKARHIEFFAIGLSYPVAHTAACKFLLLGLPSVAHADSHIQLIGATQLKAGDVAFGVSLSGTTSETVQCLEVARMKGATTICLTNALNSAVTKHSDLCLYATPSEVMYFQAPLASRITQLAVIDALFVSLALKHRNKTAGRLQQSAEELLKRRSR